MIDLYCERLGPGLLGEPLNLLSNLAFPIAALASRRYARTRGGPGGVEPLLVGLMAAIGAGSALFHALATPAARLADALPILLFQAAFLWLYLRRVAGARPPLAILACAGLVSASLIASLFPHILNGSLPYVPAAVLVLELGLYHYRTAKPEPHALLAAGGLFALALLFRTVDLAVCPTFPTGTHFLWHVLNAGVLYMAFRGLAASWGLSRLAG